jgi:hypothetical protein
MQLSGEGQSTIIKLSVGLSLGALLIYYAKKIGVKGVSGAAVDAVSNAVGGVVESIGSAVGIPPTNQTECEKAIAEGRTWDSSFSCKASDFIGSLFGTPPASHSAATSYNLPYDPSTGNDW